MFVLLVMGISKGFQWTERKLLSENPRFEIQQLVVECNGKLTEDFIREMSQLHEGQNLLLGRSKWKLIYSKSQESNLFISSVISEHVILQVKGVIQSRLMGNSNLRYPFLVDRFELFSRINDLYRSCH